MSHDNAGPATGHDRIGELDIIRGFALFGVLWMNLYGHRDFAIAEGVLERLPTAPVDQVVGFFTQWLAAGKAQALFSLLFGFGFAILMDRAEKRGANATSIYLRRLTILLIIGVAHLSLIWWGDILHSYAALGFLLLLTRRWPSKLLLGAGLFLATMGTALMGLYYYLTLPAGQPIPFMAAMRAGSVRRWETFQGSDYGAFVGELSTSIFNEIYSHPLGFVFLGWIFGRFMIGAWIYRQGWLQDTARYAAGFRRWGPILLGTGLMLALISPLLGLLELRVPPPWNNLARAAGMTGQLVLALGYGAMLVVICGSERWRLRLFGLGAVGQMALTNYLAQSLVYFFVLYGFGLGLLPYAGATFCLGVALLFFALQIAFSRWWLARYRFGPAEWLWRSGTYGKWQPLRRAPAAEPLPAE